MLLLYTILLSNYLTLAYCQQPTPTIDLPAYVRGRLFSASRTAPIATALSASPDARNATATLTDFFALQDRALQAALAHSRNASAESLPPFRVCTYSGPWTRASSNYISNRGWLLPSRPECVTDIYGAPTSEQFSALSLFDTVTALHSAVNASVAPIIQSTVPNWTEGQQPSSFPFARGSQTCQISQIAAFRLDGRWHLSTGITNHPRDAWVPDGQRRYLTENIRLDIATNTLTPKLMTLPANPTHAVVTDATTSLTMWQGAPHPSQFHAVDIASNLALQEALDQGDLLVQQLDGATTASNIAILALPIALCLIPVALIADVSPLAVLVYAMLSDVLTALPMAIKGIELLMIDHRRFAAHVTRLGDTSKDPRATAVAGELWVCVCRTREDARPIGIAFVVFALAMMVIGLALEVLCRRYTGHRKGKKVNVSGKTPIKSFKTVAEDFADLEVASGAVAEVYDDRDARSHGGSLGDAWWAEEFGSDFSVEADVGGDTWRWADELDENSVAEELVQEGSVLLRGDSSGNTSACGADLHNIKRLPSGNAE